MLKRLKGRNAKILLVEYSELKRRYWGGHLWGIRNGVPSGNNSSPIHTNKIVRESLQNKVNAIMGLFL